MEAKGPETQRRDCGGLCHSALQQKAVLRKLVLSGPKLAKEGPPITLWRREDSASHCCWPPVPQREPWESSERTLLRWQGFRQTEGQLRMFVNRSEQSIMTLFCKDIPSLQTKFLQNSLGFFFQYLKM